MAWRLSPFWRPLPRPSSTFARPSRKYSRSGTSARRSWAMRAWRRSISAAVQQQLAASVGIVGADAVGELVRGDVHALQPQLAPGPAGVGVGELDLAEPQALDLAALQHDPGLDGVEDGVVVARPAVGGDRRGAVTGRGRVLMGLARVARHRSVPADRYRAGRAGAAAGRRRRDRRAGQGALPVRGVRADRRTGRRVDGDAVLPVPQRGRVGPRVHDRSRRPPARRARRRGQRAGRSSASSTATPTPRPPRARPTSPRRRTRRGTTPSSACATRTPSLRSYRIVDGTVTEEPVAVV